MILCFAIVYLVWGSSYIATSIGVHALPPFLFGGIRFTIGGLLLFIVARALGRRATLTATEWRHLLIVGFGTVLIGNGCNVWAMQWVKTGQAALLNASMAFWIPLLGMFGLRAHRLTRPVATGLLIGFSGTALILWPRAASGAIRVVGAPAPLIPELVILVGCLSWSAATIYMRTFRSQLDVLTFTALQMLCGGLMLLTFGISRGELAAWTWSTNGLLAMSYMIVFSSCIAYTAYGWLAQNATPAQVGSYAFVNPGIATALGWLILGERLSGVQVLGMAIILAGVVLVTWPRAQSQPVPAS